MAGATDAAGSPPLLYQVPGAVWTTDRDLRVTAAFGSSLAGRDDLVGSTLYDLVGTRDPHEPAIARHLAALAGRQQSFRYTVSARWFQVRLAPLLDEAGQTVGCVGIAVDVTAQHKVEERRERTRSQLADAQRLCHVGSFEWDVGTGRVVWSDEMHNIFAVSRDAFEGTLEGFFSRVHPDDRETMKARIGELVRSGGTFVGEHRIVRPDGTVREIETRGEVVRGARGETIAVIGSAMDVTELRESERRLERKRSLLRATLEATADGLLVVDRAGKVVTYNERFVSLWRLPGALVRSKDDAAILAFVLDQLVDPDQFVRGVRELYAEPGRESFDVLHFKDGRVYERYSRPQRVGDRVTGRVWSFRDVTERERALRAREELLSIVAHEIRSPVTSIHLSVQTLRRRDAPPDAALRAIDIVEREDRRLARFVDELIDMGRIQGGRLDFRIEDVNLSDVARSVAEQLGADFARARSPLTLHVDPHVHGRWDRFRLEEVLTNLLTNAMKFGSGKPIELTVHQLDGHALVRVTDHGMGIPPEMQEKIFLPYERGVSSHQIGGVGLGLYIVKTIVQGLGGSIRVESRPGEATTFTVELPEDGEKYSSQGKKPSGLA
jgi:PAS domain S-box-containing protein